eukprot:TRINITY_DN1512_c0_g1_i2.p1 TRINITY_DN1512_c0_g1~~TRINITY_DN1512_c0_g1_i2.p1  ORF type:complete len:311 (-),score=35.89 TRINITY_DN1512_c0_g1_i2:5-937(-)
MDQQGFNQPYSQNHRSSSDDKLKAQFQEFGSNVRAASQRADQLLQNSQYPYSQQQYAQPVSLPTQPYQQQQYQPQQQQQQQQKPAEFNPVIRSQQQQQPQPQQIHLQHIQQQQQVPQFYQQQHAQQNQQYQPVMKAQPVQQIQYQPVVQAQPSQKVQVQQYQPEPVYQKQEYLNLNQEAYSYISGQEKGQPIQEKYLEYVPYDRKEIEYIPVQKIEHVPKEKTIREYQIVERVVEKVPIKTYQTTIEYVPVERVEEHVEYQTREHKYIKETISQSQYEKQTQQPQQIPQQQGYNPVANSRQMPPKQQQYY